MSGNEILIIIGMALVTFGIRYPVLVAFGRIPLPSGATRGLRYVPAAVLAAIIAPAMLMPGGTSPNLSITNAHLIAGLVAVLVAWRTKNVLATIVIGMLAFWAWRFLI